MFICMCTKRKTRCLFFPPFARDSYLETPCRQVVEQRDIDLGVHDREVGSGSCFSLGEGNQNIALESKDVIPRKLTNGIRRKCSFFNSFPWIPKEIRSELGFRESSIQARLFLVVAMTDRISHQNWLHPKLFINHFHLFLVYTVYLHEGFHFWSFITCSLRCWNPFKSPCPWHGTCPISQQSWSPSLFCRTGESSCACRFFLGHGLSGVNTEKGEHRRPRLWMSIRS